MAEEIKNKETVDKTEDHETPVNPEPATDPVDQKDPKKKELTIKLPDIKAGAKKLWKGTKKVAGGIAIGAAGGLAVLGGLAYIGSKMEMKPLPEPEEDDDQDEEEKEDEES
jgi:hypothetical protein